MSGLIADIGGTNARFALIDDDGETGSEEVLACRDYPTLVDACQAYLRKIEVRRRPRRAAFAVASPIAGDRVQMTNHVWSFSIEETRRFLGLDHLQVINDFLAIALAIPHLSVDDVVKVGSGTPIGDAPILAIGPGTGLGMASLVPMPGGGWIPLAGEGGHVTMAPAEDMETAVISLMRKRIGHVSAERLISGPGLVNLYRALAELGGKEPDPEITPPLCSARALDGSCEISGKALAMMCAMLGTIAANAALTLGARGGVYIAGGIVPSLGPAFAESRFRARFEDKGRFDAYLADVPTYVIHRPLPALLGLASLVTGTVAPPGPR